MKLLLRAAVIAALSLPTYAQAEVIELKCKDPALPSMSPYPLYVDTSFRRRIKFGVWPWSSDSIFTDELILWSSMADEGYPRIGSFIFKRETGELSVRLFTPDHFLADLENGGILYCVRPF